MATPFDQLSDLALEVYALAIAARSCQTYESGLSITARLRSAGDRLSKLAPSVFDSMTDRVLRQLMELRSPEIPAADIAAALATPGEADAPEDDDL